MQDAVRCAVAQLTQDMPDPCSDTPASPMQMNPWSSSAPTKSAQKKERFQITFRTLYFWQTGIRCTLNAQGKQQPVQALKMRDQSICEWQSSSFFDSNCLQTHDDFFWLWRSEVEKSWKLTLSDLHPLIHHICSQSFLKMVEIPHNLWEFPFLQLSHLSPSQKQLSASHFTHPSLRNLQGLFLILPQINGKFLFFNEAISPPKFATPQTWWAWILQNAVQNP